MSGTPKSNPRLFLFDGYAEEVKEPALSTFTMALLTAISIADPKGRLTAELRGGLPMLAEFAAQISEVSSAPKQSGHTQTHDMALYRSLLWDVATALSGNSNSPDTMKILDVLRMSREECLALSAMPDDICARCDAVLRSKPGYIGSYNIDTGNPVLTKAFYRGLMHLAYIKEGTIFQQRSIEGDEDFSLEGAQMFQPNGFKWIDHDYGDMPSDFKLRLTEISPRGALSVDRLKRKVQTTVEGRVFRALIDASWTDYRGQVYKFAAAEPEQDILQAVLPEGKFTKYLFNKDHKDGGSKAKFVMDVLGFEAEDWRFLAAQLYDGLLLSEPRDLVIKRWESGYGARFDVLVEVTSRAGKRGVLRAGWMLEPGKLPSLSTALPDHGGVGVARPPLPPVVSAQFGGDEFWLQLFIMAHDYGCAAHTATLPTPMLTENFGVIEEGECGSACAVIADSQLGFAKWLIDTGNGCVAPLMGIAVWCPLPSPSLERAEAYASAFARVLTLNGVPSHVEFLEI